MEVAGWGGRQSRTFRACQPALVLFSPEARLPQVPGGSSPRGSVRLRPSAGAGPDSWMAAAEAGASCSTRLGFQEQLFPVKFKRRRSEMNLRGKGSVSQAKIPLEWADVPVSRAGSSRGAGVRGREEEGCGGRERAYVYL